MIRSGLRSVAGVLLVACVDTGIPGARDVDGDAVDVAVDAARDARSERVTLLAPPPGVAAPLNLAAIVLERADPAGVVTIVDEDGEALDSSSRIPAADDPRCAGRAVGSCVVVDLAEPLAAAREYQVRVDDVDTGIRLVAGAEWDFAAPLAKVEVVSSDGCLVARARVDEHAWLALAADGRAAASPGIATSHEAALVWLADGTFGARVTVEDLAANVTEVVVPSVVATARPGWAVSEVLSNPAGPEPAQEWVELVRLGDSPASLHGLRLGDGSGVDALPDVVVAPGARALVVTSSWDPSAPGDVAPAPGTAIAAIDGTTLGLGGLANGGETVTLFDPGGLPISTFTAYFDQASTSWNGRSVERRRPGGCDVRDNAAPNAAHSSTPGARNSVE